MKPGLAVLPLEVWADIFLSPWFTRQELAQILDGISNRNFASKLEKLLHGCGQQTLGALKISSKLNSWKYQLRKCTKKSKHQLRKWHIRKIPKRQARLIAEDCLDLDNMECKFPQCELPENISKFKELKIRHLDDQVLAFLDKLRPLFTNVYLIIDAEKPTDEKMRTLFAHLLPLLDGIRKISCSSGYLQTMEHHFPNALASAKELSVYAERASIPAMLNWLSAPRDFAMHGPRFMSTTASGNAGFAVVDAIRKHFLAATTPATFVLFLKFDGSHDSIDKFKLELKNAATNELLTAQKAWLYDNDGFYRYYLEILRHPVGEEAKMREWIKQRAYFDKSCIYEYDQGQVISICNWRYWPLTIGHITRKAEAMNEEEDESNGEQVNEPGPSAKE